MSIEKIRQDLEKSRASIGTDYAALRAELDYVAKAKKSVKEYPASWLGGAAVAGFIGARIFKRKRSKPKRVKRVAQNEVAESAKKITFLSVVLAIFRLIMPMLKPALVSYAGKRIGAFASSRF